MIPVAPMLLSRSAAPISKAGWLAELKYDGWRVIVDVSRSGVQVWTRHGRNITRRVPSLTTLKDALRAPAILDAELCVLDEFGHPRFDRLMSRGVPHTLVAFDLLQTRGRWITDDAWSDRRDALNKIVIAQTPTLITARAVENADWLFAECMERGLEGIVCKREGSPYLPGRRSPSWVKVKTAPAIARGRAIARRLARSA